MIFQMAYSSPKEDPELSAEEKELILGCNVSKEPVTVIPWKLILSKGPVWALIISHFCHNWGTFILLTWMPTYYNQVLNFNLIESGLLCVLPWFTMVVFANIGGWIADTLVSRGFSITTFRKIMQSIGYLGPAFFLSQLSRVKTPAMHGLQSGCFVGTIKYCWCARWCLRYSCNWIHTRKRFTWRMKLLTGRRGGRSGQEATRCHRSFRSFCPSFQCIPMS